MTHSESMIRVTSPLRSINSLMGKKLPNYLRMYRKRSGFSQAEVARLLGGTNGTNISRYERGSRLPSLETALALAAIFKTPIHELFSGVYEYIEAHISEQAEHLIKSIGCLEPTREILYKKDSLERMVSPHIPLPRETEQPEDRELGIRVVALDPTSHGFGFVVFEGDTKLVDWGHAHIRPCTNAKCLAHVAGLLAHYVPQVIVVEDWESRESRRGKRVRKLLTEIVEFARGSKAEVARFSVKDIQQAFSPDGSPSKYQIAEMIALEFPELSFRLPPPRKIWDSEDERMSIFDAAALALTYFQTREEV